MVGRVIRVVIGFVVACLAAGLTMVLFVFTPADLATDVSGDHMSEAGLLALAAATHAAIFSAPFALIGAAIGEWRSLRSWTYYVLVGIVIAVIGFLAQYSSESASEASIVNSYALTAFLVTGFVGGVIYWMLSGRYAGDAPATSGTVRPRVAAAPAATTPPAGSVQRAAQ